MTSGKRVSHTFELTADEVTDAIRLYAMHNREECHPRFDPADQDFETAMVDYHTDGSATVIIDVDCSTPSTAH